MLITSQGWQFAQETNIYAVLKGIFRDCCEALPAASEVSTQSAFTQFIGSRGCDELTGGFI